MWSCKCAISRHKPGVRTGVCTCDSDVSWIYHPARCPHIYAFLSLSNDTSPLSYKNTDRSRTFLSYCCFGLLSKFSIINKFRRFLGSQFSGDRSTTQQGVFRDRHSIALLLECIASERSWEAERLRQLGSLIQVKLRLFRRSEF